MEAFYSKQKRRYLMNLKEMAVFNRGACLFKNQKWEAALKIWKSIHVPAEHTLLSMAQDDAHLHADDKGKVSKMLKKLSHKKAPCYMPISLLFNMSLCHLMLSMSKLHEQIRRGMMPENADTLGHLVDAEKEPGAYTAHAEAAIDLCQELISRIFLPNKELEAAYQCKSMHEELQVIGVDIMKDKIYRLLDGLKSILCGDVRNLAKYARSLVSHNARKSPDRGEHGHGEKDVENYDVKDFRRMLLDDMKKWVHEAFLSVKLEDRQTIQFQGVMDKLIVDNWDDKEDSGEEDEDVRIEEGAEARPWRDIEPMDKPASPN